MRNLLFTLALLCTTLLPAQTLTLDSVQVSETMDTLVHDLDSVVITEEQLILSQETDSLEPTLATSDCVKLDRIHGIYYLGDDPLTRKEYREFLRVNAPDLYDRYRIGNALWCTGLACFGVGTSVAVYGGLTLFRSTMALTADLFILMLGGWGESVDYPYDKYLPIGAWCFYGGALLALASAPLIAVGAKYKFTINSRYNERCERTQTTLELSLQSFPNGIGFALKF